jgi:hypothetical protein
MDVENAELCVLRGAKDLLHRIQRPVIVCEVDDCRTKPWGYDAREIVAFLENQEYECFGLSSLGALVPIGQHDSYISWRSQHRNSYASRYATGYGDFRVGSRQVAKDI